MKKVLYYMILAVATVLVAGCKKDKEGETTPACVGEWHLTNIAVKSVTYAGQTVDVYLSLQDGGSFELYQMVGQGRFRRYTGTWKLDGTVLSGTYTSKKPWGSSYQVSVEGNTLKLTSSTSGEVDTYEKATIPASVKEEAYDM